MHKHDVGKCTRVDSCNISGNIAKHDVCSVQGYGEKAPGIGAYVYPGSGATCDTKPVHTGLPATQAAADGQSLRTTDAVSLLYPADPAVCQGSSVPNTTSAILVHNNATTQECTIETLLSEGWGILRGKLLPGTSELHPI